MSALPTYEVRETDISLDWFLVYAKRYWHVHCERSRQSAARESFRRRHFMN